MVLEDWTQVANIGQAIAVGIVGLWAIIKFRKQRTHHPHIEFSVDCNIYGESDDEQYAAEFLVLIKNKGFVQQRFKKIFLRVRGIKLDKKELLVCKESQKKELHGKGYGGRLFFPEMPISDVDIIPEYYKPYVVEPGCEETITYVTRVPAEYKYLLVHAEYLYPNTKRIGKTKKQVKPGLLQRTVTKIGLLWHGYPNRPRTTEKFIQVEPHQVQQRSKENEVVGQSQDIS